MDTLLSYKLVTRDIDRTLALKTAEPINARETAYFSKTISSIKSIDDFLGNTRVFNYAMKAFGLEEMAYAKGYMRKVLEGGVSDKNAFANRLNDDRFVQFVTAFDFAAFGDITTSRPAASTDVPGKFARQSLEADEGAENEGVRLALYFKRAAPLVKTEYGLLGDPALWKVLQTVFGFPAEMANAEIENQSKAVADRLDMKSLQDPAAVDKLIQRFAVMWDVEQGVASSPLLQLFSGSSVSDNFGMSLLSLKYGG
jgi:hypothetical protein